MKWQRVLGLELRGTFLVEPCRFLQNLRAIGVEHVHFHREVQGDLDRSTQGYPYGVLSNNRYRRDCIDPRRVTFAYTYDS